MEKLPKPLPATRDALATVVERKPVLWVGAGLSIGAGYPSTAKLVDEMVRTADDPIDKSLPFFDVADAFVRSVRKGQLAELMQKLFAAPRKPTLVHHAIARLAGAGRFHAIVTTNFDPLLEHALHEAGVAYVLQPLEDNAPITGEGGIRILKIHGSYDDWLRIILSGNAYAEFGKRYAFLTKQLDVLLRQRPVLFAGCSLQDPRILGWIAALPDDAADALKPWRALLTEKEWQDALAYRWDDSGIQREARVVLSKGNVRPMMLENHKQLETLLGELAAEVAEPARSPGNDRLEINLHALTLRAALAGCPDWQARDPRADPTLGANLHALRLLADMALPTGDHGNLAPAMASQAAELRRVAEAVAGVLTDALLSPEAQKHLQTAIGASTGGAPPLLLLRVHAEDDSDEARRRADRLLALPWELLRIDGSFPVESGKLDIAREAVVPHAVGLGPPDQELSVVATVAAPVDAVRLDYEGECYRLWTAMSTEQERLLITDVGTEEDFVQAVRAHGPAAIHFTGHGKPGVLLFEDDTARAVEVDVRKLVPRLRAADRAQLPRLAFLASCYGAAIERADVDPKSRRMVDPAAFTEDPAWSSAAELHREGIHQVIAWLGPVGDAQCTRAEAAVYAELVLGRTARVAVREARQVCRLPHGEAGRATHVYPLGWAQLALYHRGDDVPVARPATKAGADLGRRERERRIERLDASRGPVGVERLKFGFIGRRTARAEVIRRFREGCRALVVQGLGGLGKTALCAELAPILARELARTGAVADNPPPVRVVAIDGRFAGEQSDPVMALWEQVQKFGEGNAWNRQLATLQKEAIGGEALADALLWLARSEGGLLVYLDDAESLQQPLGAGEIGAWKHPEIAVFWQRLLAAAGRASRFGLLASARYVPQGLATDAWYPLGVMREIDLVRLVKWWPVLGQLKAKDVEWLVARIDGHPRSLQWLDGWATEKARQLAGPGGSFHGDLRREVIEAVLPERDAKLSADLLLPRLIEAVGHDAGAHLSRCAILEEPAPWGAILALQDGEGTGNRLAQVGLLSAFEPPQGGDLLWAPHRMVAAAAPKLAEKDALEAHRRAGTWFRAEWEKNDDALDLAAGAARHLCAGGDGTAAWEPAQRVVLWRRHLGRYREALAWVDRVLAANPTGPERGVALAFTVQLGRMAGAVPPRAEARLKEALELVGESDRSFVLDELGKLLRHQGRLREAAQALEQSVAIETQLKGEEHPDVAASLHELARVLQAQGDLPGARELLERSLRIQAKVYETEEHPDVAASLQVLAGVLEAQGDLSGARKRLERALQIQAKVYGTEEHPSVAASLHALAGVLQAQGDLSGARERLERSLRIKAKVYGTEEHPSVAASLHALAGVLKAQGDLSGARERLERVLAIEERIYGTRDHSSTAITEASLGMLLLQLGEPQRGAELLVHAYQTFLKQLGPDHPHTQQLASWLQQLVNPQP